MRANELRRIAEEELANKETATREELFNLRVQIATQQTTNVARIRVLKKELARILTIKRERLLNINKEK